MVLTGNFRARVPGGLRRGGDWRINPQFCNRPVQHDCRDSLQFRMSRECEHEQPRVSYAPAHPSSKMMPSKNGGMQFIRDVREGPQNVDIQDPQPSKSQSTTCHIACPVETSIAQDKDPSAHLNPVVSAVDRHVPNPL